VSRAAPSKVRPIARPTARLPRAVESTAPKVCPLAVVSKVRPTTRPTMRPTTRRTLRAVGGRRVVIEGFGKRALTFIVIAGNGEVSAGAWLSPAELHRFIEVAKRILK
jgi:hypothetical protein